MPGWRVAARSPREMRVGQPLVDQVSVRVARGWFDRTRPRPGAPGATGSPAQERAGRRGSSDSHAKRESLDARPDGVLPELGPGPASQTSGAPHCPREPVPWMSARAGGRGRGRHDRRVLAARDLPARAPTWSAAGRSRCPSGAWTDDTSMALCLAESAGRARRVRPGRPARALRALVPRGALVEHGQAASTSAARRGARCERFERTGEPFPGDAAPDAAGNGPLMKLAPVALAYAHDRRGREPLTRARARARRTARPRRSTPRGSSRGCSCEALNGAPKQDVLRRRDEPGAGPEGRGRRRRLVPGKSRRRSGATATSCSRWRRRCGRSVAPTTSRRRPRRGQPRRRRGHHRRDLRASSRARSTGSRASRRAGASASSCASRSSTSPTASKPSAVNLAGRDPDRAHLPARQRDPPRRPHDARGRVRRRADGAGLGQLPRRHPPAGVGRRRRSSATRRSSSAGSCTAGARCGRATSKGSGCARISGARAIASALMGDAEEIIRRGYDCGALGSSDDGLPFYTAVGGGRGGGRCRSSPRTASRTRPKRNAAGSWSSAASSTSTARCLCADFRDGDVW